jgi:undecaprenyl-diphosphatase
MKIDTLTPSKSGLKLFDLGTRKKLFLILCTSILWIATLIAYSIPDFNYWLVASFNTLRTDPLFAGFWYYYTKYMLYVIGIPLSILYLASFKLNNLKPYRIVFLLAIMTSAIGTPLVDPVMKDLFAVPRPGVLYPDINSLYYVNGFFSLRTLFSSICWYITPLYCFLTSDETFKETGKQCLWLLSY